jgi:hypothetical protein
MPPTSYVELHIACELGSLDTSLSFEELIKRSYINPRTRAVGADSDFSRNIREGLPMPVKAKG